MDPVWIAVAFVLGLGARQIGLPPLVGFLIAGFVLHAMGIEGTERLSAVADVGVTLLLFSIGLKLKLGSLLRPEVWAVASLHMGITIAVFAAGILGLSVVGFSLFAGMDLGVSLILAFALSFSSTVFAVKVLEDKGEDGSLHGRVAIGILIVQDLFAVLFLALSVGKIPTPWALLLLLLIPGRPLVLALMTRCGHGELLMLFGLLLAVLGAEGFELVGVKGDLGAIVLGLLVSAHPKAPELAKSLLGFKDLFLVAFFVTIGLSGAPGPEAFGIAILLATVVPLKVGLFFWLLTRFRLRARSSALTSFSLANYSEFGLIVGAVAASQGWIGSEWLVILAVALSITFVLASPLNTAAHTVYARMQRRLEPFEGEKRIPEEADIAVGEASVVVVGMGRVGTGAYDYMRERFGETVAALDNDPATVKAHQATGRRVFLGDVMAADFRDRVRVESPPRLVLLAMRSHAANLEAVRLLVSRGYPGMITATAQFPDEIEELERAGVEAAFNLYAEAGSGFAEHVAEQLGERLTG
jgi:predicted Kef-type K+ transport protein